MSDDDARTDEEQEPEAPEAVHDDIMKRLVDYQRSLRGGATPHDAAASAWPATSKEPAPGSQVQAPPPEFVDVSSTGSEIVAEPPLEVIHEIEAEAGAETKEVEERIPADEVGPSQPPPAEARVTIRPAAARSESEVAARIAELEGTLDRLGRLFGELRENFQDLAVAADTRLATIEAEIAEARGSGDESS